MLTSRGPIFWSRFWVRRVPISKNTAWPHLLVFLSREGHGWRTPLLAIKHWFLPSASPVTRVRWFMPLSFLVQLHPIPVSECITRVALSLLELATFQKSYPWASLVPRSMHLCGQLPRPITEKPPVSLVVCHRRSESRAFA